MRRRPVDHPSETAGHAQARIAVHDLRVEYGDHAALAGISLGLQPGELHVLLGPSGAGKSTLINGLTGMLPGEATVSGSADLCCGEEHWDLVRTSGRTFRSRILGRITGVTIQGSVTGFTATSTIGTQLREAMRVLSHKPPLASESIDRRPGRLLPTHPHVASADPDQRIRELCWTCGAEVNWLDRYPHQLSGGQLSRLGLMAAMIAHPPVLLADEPTSGLDADSARAIIGSLANFAHSGHAVLLITHEADLARRFADQVLIIENGTIITQGGADAIPGRPISRHHSATGPAHSEIAPDSDTAGQQLSERAFLIQDGQPPRTTVTDPEPGIHDRRPHPPTATTSRTVRGLPALSDVGEMTSVATQDHLADQAPASDAEATRVLAARGVTRVLGGRPIVHDLDIEIPRGQIVGLAGPSGVGKSTLASMLALLVAPDEGSIEIDGHRLQDAGLKLAPAIRRKVGWVSQQPFTAVDPRMRLGEAIELPARLAGVDVNIDELAKSCGLDPALLTRHPHQVSGGELQRACVVRALALQPDYLVLDEITAMLDERTAIDLLQCIRDQVHERHIGALLISHDQRLLDEFADVCWTMEPTKTGTYLRPHSGSFWSHRPTPYAEPGQARRTNITGMQ